MLRFLTFLGLCPHSHDRRERDSKGRVVFVCEGCGRSVPAIDRTPKERKAMLKRYHPVIEAKAIRVPRATVTPLWRAK